MRLRGSHNTQARLTECTDLELFCKVREGGTVAESAFRELYGRLSGSLYAYCRCLAWRREESDDLFQEAITRLYESALQGRDISNISGYVIKIARNLYLNMQRDRKPVISIEHDTLAMAAVPHEKTEMLELIHMAMELLSEDYREAFFLREFADMPYEEIAQVMNLTNVNVRIRVTRAREKIRKILEPYIAEYEQEQKKQ
ncbi:MAG: RNA polymerase sigma factor [Bacteroidetes bacterium]|nr:RNA polymerase sigma factor [Bacteroidota bacterium]